MATEDTTIEQPTEAPDTQTETAVEPAPAVNEPSSVPYTRFRDVNLSKKEYKRQAKLFKLERDAALAKLQANSPNTPQAPAPAPEPADTTPEGKALKLIKQGASAAVNEAVAPLRREMERLSAGQVDTHERDSFWESNQTDKAVQAEVERKYLTMRQQAVEAGFKPQFTREDILNYELGLRYRQGSLKSPSGAPAQGASVNRAALGVAGARPAAPRPGPKSPDDMTAAELEADMNFRNHQF